jgi:DNA polymerase/3'-5' exonuclease PolX
MNLSRAQKLSLAIVSELIPFCEKIEIAGSVRRECSNVNDIDIVLIPKLGGKDKIIGRCSRKLSIFTGRRPDPNNVTFIAEGGDLQLDLFFAHGDIDDLVSTTPTNWGAVYLCRTGSMQHNIQLCNHAITKGLKFAPYRGVVKKIRAIQAPGVFLDGDLGEEIIASATEEAIYESLGLPWRHPRERDTLEPPK